MRATLVAEESEVEMLIAQDEAHEKSLIIERDLMAVVRGVRK